MKFLLQLAIFVAHASFSSNIEATLYEKKQVKTFSPVNQELSNKPDYTEENLYKDYPSSLNVQTNLLDNSKCVKLDKNGNLEAVFRPRSPIVSPEEFPSEKYVVVPYDRKILEKIEYLKNNGMNFNAIKAIKENDNYKEIAVESNTEDEIYLLIPTEYAGVSLINNIVLHYTVSPTVNATYDAFYRNGTSAQFVVNVDGIIYLLLPPENYVAFHAGLSFWDFKYLNKRSIGIEIVGLGFVEESKTYQKLALDGAIKLDGDERTWFQFPDAQLEAVYKLTAFLQKRFYVPGKNVVTHADIAYDRKSDAGPMLLYQIGYGRHHAGFYPKNINFCRNIFGMLTKDDCLAMLYIYGYGKAKNEEEENFLIKVFKMHYGTKNESGYPVNISPELDETAKHDVLNLIIDYANEHQKSSHPSDKDYINRLVKYIEDKKLAFLKPYLFSM